MSAHRRWQQAVDDEAEALERLKRAARTSLRDGCDYGCEYWALEWARAERRRKRAERRQR